MTEWQTGTHEEERKKEKKNGFPDFIFIYGEFMWPYSVVSSKCQKIKTKNLPITCTCVIVSCPCLDISYGFWVLKKFLIIQAALQHKPQHFFPIFSTVVKCPKMNKVNLNVTYYIHLFAGIRMLLIVCTFFCFNLEKKNHEILAALQYKPLYNFRL